MGLGQRLRRWRPPRTLRITRSGRTLLMITLGIGLGALNTGNNLLYLVLGLLLSLIVLSGVLSERCLGDLRVRRLLPEGAFAGEPMPLRYEVTRTAGRAFALTLEEEGRILPGVAWLPVVAAGAPAVVRMDVVPPRRGPLALQAIVVSTEFPFGLFEKRRTLVVEDVLLVWPRRGDAGERSASSASVSLGEVSRSRQRDGGGDLLGLRALGEGEDARRVHWKKSAAAGQLLKVEREREDRRQYTVHVPRQPLGEALDRACEEVAALTHALLEEGHEVGLLAFDRRLRPSAGPSQERRVLAALALLGFTPGAEPP